MVIQDRWWVFVGKGWGKLGLYRYLRPYMVHTVMVREEVGDKLGDLSIGKKF